MQQARMIVAAAQSAGSQNLDWSENTEAKKSCRLREAFPDI
jgi:hypothetical protein